MKLIRLIVVVCLVVVGSTQIAAEDWPCWRGADGTGIAPEGPTPPVTWSADKNVVWKTKLTGRGHGSPTIVGKRIYLATANEPEFTQSVVAIDRDTGELVWERELYRYDDWPKIHLKSPVAVTCCLFRCSATARFG